jgi:hypothetical protein
LGIATILGVPVPIINFYPLILGAVLFGIGIALLIEFYGDQHGIRGLGIAGAIAINFCGGTILIIWLLFSSVNLPLRGCIILWTIAIVVLIIGIIKLHSKSWEN